ncbi:DNA-deoxyinosine glycosylase [Gudongella sp. SC589]|uniref:DNA-deoxyinosine glycosylase n=1 Tax=Gudongella sp. SC589 TaxID=3385990 RepID=UPI0039049585
MDKIKSFDPIVDINSKILILGSMPGNMSLEKGEYYAHLRNHFWRIIFDLFNEPYQDDYAGKLEFLLVHGIAVWDVIAECRREGSLDARISDEKPNEIVELLKSFSGIEVIMFNGLKAYQSYKKMVGFDKKPDVTYIRLPSTSPIPTRRIRTYEDKLAEWKIIYAYVSEKD